jgi:hypothetical protein
MASSEGALSESLEYDENTDILYEVIEPWLPERFDELALTPGDVVLIKNVYEDGWCEGHLIGKDQEIGAFPMACVKVK